MTADPLTPAIRAAAEALRQNIHEHIDWSDETGMWIEHDAIARIAVEAAAPILGAEWEEEYVASGWHKKALAWQTRAEKAEAECDDLSITKAVLEKLLLKVQADCDRLHKELAAREGDLALAHVISDARDEVVQRLERAEQELAKASSFIRLLGEELVNADMPAGDRTVILANVRELIKRVANGD